MISASQLAAFAPRCDVETLAPILDVELQKGAINTGLRVCHFLGQTAEETGGFTVFLENLNYSAERLLAIWPRHFTPDEAAAYAHQPERIANRAYGGRGGNGDEASGDGWRYRGRGLLQTTFRENYAALSKVAGIDFVAQPELLEQPLWAVRSAVAFWTAAHLNRQADANDLVAITRVVNGGLGNLATREAMFAAARRIWSDAVVAGSLGAVQTRPPVLTVVSNRPSEVLDGQRAPPPQPDLEIPPPPQAAPERALGPPLAPEAIHVAPGPELPSAAVSGALAAGLVVAVLAALAALWAWRPWRRKPSPVKTPIKASAPPLSAQGAETMATKPNIITQIFTGAQKLWANISSAIEQDVAKVEAVLPAAAPVVAGLKQGASDVLGQVAAGDFIPQEQTLVTGLEGLLDGVLTAKTGGLAVPLVFATNGAIQDAVALANKAAEAWALKAQAALAENNAAMQGGTAAPAVTLAGNATGG